MITPQALYLTTSSILVLSGLTLVGMGVRAYARTKKQSMVHLSLGFTLVVSAAISTALTIQIGDYRGVSVLIVNSGMSALGFLFVIYSLISYRR